MALNTELVEKVISEVFEGASLAFALNKHGVSRQAFYNYARDNLKSEADYARARDSRTELLVEQLVEIADNPEIDPNRARNMISVRQWIASKLIPHTYGDKLDLNVTSTASITDALAAASARVLPLRDQTIDAQYEVLEFTGDKSNGATGSKPVGDSNSNSGSDST